MKTLTKVLCCIIACLLLSSALLTLVNNAILAVKALSPLAILAILGFMLSR